MGLPFLPEPELGVNFCFLIGLEGDLNFEDIQLIGKWLASNYWSDPLPHSLSRLLRVPSGRVS